MKKGRALPGSLSMLIFCCCDHHRPMVLFAFWSALLTAISVQVLEVQDRHNKTNSKSKPEAGEKAETANCPLLHAPLSLSLAHGVLEEPYSQLTQTLLCLSAGGRPSAAVRLQKSGPRNTPKVGRPLGETRAQATRQPCHVFG